MKTWIVLGALATTTLAACLGALVVQKVQTRTNARVAQAPKPASP